MCCWGCDSDIMIFIFSFSMMGRARLPCFEQAIVVVDMKCFIVNMMGVQQLAIRVPSPERRSARVCTGWHITRQGTPLVSKLHWMCSTLIITRVLTIDGVS